ncbi:hypothetical protein WR25_04332 [Diploscapter pachys]|uniref:MARVEL domain-containing protein n=1 Tax=Diploscapter pachys TaxID=2018661 RepID=A0A2A2L9X4_9BILA|nr:hypothetical protein WR25_04332 [Diploscapter pachys]
MNHSREHRTTIYETREYYLDATPKMWECCGKLMNFDTLYPSTSRGILKVVEIALCFLCIILVCACQPVGNERGIALVFCFIGLVLSFTFLITYVLMLNLRVQATPWFVAEVSFYVLMIVGLLTSAVFMAVFNAYHWSAINPAWEVMPAITAAALIVTAIVYLADLIILVSYWKRYSWKPNIDYLGNIESTVLPH